MSPLDRLLAEAVPDGTFGGTRTPHRQQRTQPRPAEPAPAWTPAEQAAHVAALEAALGTRRPQPTRRHLRAVPDAA